MKMYTGVLTVVFGLQMLATAGVRTEGGTDLTFWSTHSVIYGRVLSAFGENSWECVVEIVPYATFTGSFDAALHRTIKAKMYVGRTDMVTRPPINQNVILVLFHVEEDYCVSPSRLLFMPEMKAVLEVKDLSDPKVANIIEVLRELRAPKKGSSVES